MPDQFTPVAPGQPADSPQPPAGAPAGPRTYGGYGSSGGYGDYGGYGDRPGESGNQLMDYVRTVYKHRWIALTAFAVLFLGMAINTFSATPIYQGRVQLLLEPLTPNVVTFKEVIEQNDNNYDYYPTQYAILKSRALARRTIDALKLWDHPEFGGGGAPAPKPFSLVGTLRGALSGAVGWVSGLFSAAPAPVSAPGAGETSRQSRIIDAFLGRLTVSPVKNSRLVDVAVRRRRTPGWRRRWPTRSPSSTSSRTSSTSSSPPRKRPTGSAQQLAVERKKLEDSELALQRYREKGDAVALEDRQNIVVQRLTDLNSAYTKARTDRFEKEALYNQLKGLQNDRTALDTFPAILSNAFIQQLKSQLADLQRQQAQMADRLGEKHPDMIKQSLGHPEHRGQAERRDREGRAVGAERVPVRPGAGAQPRRGPQRPEGRRAVAEPDGHRVRRAAARGREQQADVRDADAARQGDGDLRRTEDQQHPDRRPGRGAAQPDPAEQVEGPAARARWAGSSPASASRSSWSTLDNRVKNPDEIKQFLGLSFLGLVPACSEKELDDGRSPLLTDAVPQNFAEAFRGIRTNVMFSSAEEGPRSVLVTSTQPHEGKTVVAANLAIVAGADRPARPAD